MIDLTVIIPSAESIGVVRRYLPVILEAAEKRESIQFVFVDASSEEGVQDFCVELNVAYLPSKIAHRAAQMNAGASIAKSEHLFFLHLDSFPPESYDRAIHRAFTSGANSGCFRMTFHPTTTFLSFFAFFTRFHWRTARGGDQGLFVRKTVFEQLGGFDENLTIMEDMDICHKLEKQRAFTILKGPMRTSARKYQEEGQWKLQSIYFVVTLFFWMGMENRKLVKIYRRMLGKERKNHQV